MDNARNRAFEYAVAEWYKQEGDEARDTIESYREWLKDPESQPDIEIWYQENREYFEGLESENAATSKKKKPFYQQIWFFALVGIIFIRFISPDSDAREFKDLMRDGEAAFESGDYSLAESSAVSALKLKPDNENAISLKEKSMKEIEKMKIAEEKARKEKEIKEKEEAEKREKDAKVAEATAVKAQEKIEPVISELIELGSGLIKDIKPTSGDDWIAVYVFVDNSWYLLSDEEKKYTAETIGPAISNAIVQTGVTDYSDVHFVDENGNAVASPKFWSGGYKIKN